MSLRAVDVRNDDAEGRMTNAALRLGVPIGQQNLTIDEMRSRWRRVDGVACRGVPAADTRHARLGCPAFHGG